MQNNNIYEFQPISKLCKGKHLWYTCLLCYTVAYILASSDLTRLDTVKSEFPDYTVKTPLTH